MPWLGLIRSSNSNIPRNWNVLPLPCPVPAFDRATLSQAKVFLGNAESDQASVCLDSWPGLGVNIFPLSPGPLLDYLDVFLCPPNIGQRSKAKISSSVHSTSDRGARQTFSSFVHFNIRIGTEEQRQTGFPLSTSTSESRPGTGTEEYEENIFLCPLDIRTKDHDVNRRVSGHLIS